MGEPGSSGPQSSLPLVSPASLVPTGLQLPRGFVLQVKMALTVWDCRRHGMEPFAAGPDAQGDDAQMPMVQAPGRSTGLDGHD